MMIVGIDTSTRYLKLGLADDSEIISEFTLLTKDSHTRHLLSGLKFLLTQNNIRREEIEAFGVVVGPGSFTGLRIGLATILGIISAWDIVAYPVCSPDIALLNNRGILDTDDFIYVIDAKRKEVFLAHFRYSSGDFNLVDGEIKVFSYRDSIDYVSRIDRRVTILGDGIKLLINHGFENREGVVVLDLPFNGYGGGAVAKFAKIASKGPTKKLEPLYLREPDIRV